MQRVGTFDENVYPVYFEDQDYEWRLERAGLRSVHIRDASSESRTRNHLTARPAC